ncbi:glycosyltransferase [Syntrophomonas erecta subsp. sporosyntropha]
MKLEVLVSTMHQTDCSLIDKMKLTSNVLIINQVDDDNHEINSKYPNVRVLTFKERGLSNSRNRAIDNSSADICVISDDDVIYNEDYEGIIINAYNQYPEADVIVFKVALDYRKKKYPKNKKKLGFFSSLKVSSNQITFRLKSIKDKKIKFNPLFGAGSGKYISGEENIFMHECLRKKLNIIYVPKEISTVYQSESTWFKGYTAKYFISKGAYFKEIFGFFYLLGIIQFLIRKRSMYINEINMISAFSYMLRGARNYEK